MTAQLSQGLIQIYTGDGKGKTTAAIGLAIRAAGAGLKVYIHQFIKNACYSEIGPLLKVRNVVVEQSGRGCFITGEPKAADIERAARGLAACARRISSGRFSIVILDEANVALRLGLIDADELLRILKGRPRGVEIILTGRSCPKKVLKHADLVTKMVNVAHPYDRGIKARRGIEY